MQYTDTTFDDIEIALAALAPAALDSLRISVQKSREGKKQHHSKTRFSPDRWHIMEFSEWAERAESARYLYTGVDVWGDIKLATGPLLGRWSAEYRRRMLAVVYSWAETATQQGDTIHLVTLTARHGRSGSKPDMMATVDKLRQAWQGIRYSLSRSGCRYLRVIEPGEMRGYPHIHLVLSGASDDFCEALVQRWLSACPGALRAGQDWERCEDVQRVGAYVCKYLGKSLDFTPSREFWRWQELCYSCRLRTVAMDSESRRYIRDKYAAAAAAKTPPAICGSTDIRYDSEPGEQETPANPREGVGGVSCYSVQSLLSSSSGAECPPCGGMQAPIPPGRGVEGRGTPSPNRGAEIAEKT